MQLDELKKSMSTLEQVLAKTSSDININVEASETAQRRYSKSIASHSLRLPFSRWYSQPLGLAM